MQLDSVQLDTVQPDTVASVPGALIPPVPAILAIVVAFALLAIVVTRSRRRR